MDKELLLKYIAGKASQKEKEDVAAWIDADAANLKEFISLRKSYDAFIWQDTGAFSKRTKKTISLHLYLSLLLLQEFRPYRYVLHNVR